jgi:hypothetical protein
MKGQKQPPHSGPTWDKTPKTPKEASREVLTLSKIKRFTIVESLNAQRL